MPTGLTQSPEALCVSMASTAGGWCQLSRCLQEPRLRQLPFPSPRVAELLSLFPEARQPSLGPEPGQLRLPPLLSAQQIL